MGGLFDKIFSYYKNNKFNFLVNIKYYYLYSNNIPGISVISFSKTNTQQLIQLCHVLFIFLSFHS